MNRLTPKPPAYEETPTVAAFILGLLGFAVAVASLTWQVCSFLLQGARPKLTPVIGMRSAGGLVYNDATRDVRESLRLAAAQLPPGPLVIGVKVVNAGRASFPRRRMGVAQ